MRPVKQKSTQQAQNVGVLMDSKPSWVFNCALLPWEIVLPAGGSLGIKDFALQSPCDNHLDLAPQEAFVEARDLIFTESLLYFPHNLRVGGGATESSNTTGSGPGCLRLTRSPY